MNGSKDSLRRYNIIALYIEISEFRFRFNVVHLGNDAFLDVYRCHHLS